MRIVSGILAAAVVATAFVVPTEPAAAQAVESVDGQELALACQIVDRAYPEDRREAVFFATMDELTAQMRNSIMPSEQRGNRGCS